MSSIAQIEFEIQQSSPETAVFCFDELDSTSHYLKQYAETHLKEAFCFTLSQTSGYGQQSRAWQSDFSSITFSTLLHFKVPLHEVDGLTQLIALKLVESLSDFTSESFKIKWPNDLYVNDKKAGGILIECVSFTDTDCWLVVGVGLNNGLKTDVIDALTGQSSIPGSIKLAESDKLPFLINVLNRQLVLAQRFGINEFKQYLVNYSLVDYFKVDEPVIVYDSAIKQPGFYKGLTKNGELLVELDHKLCTFRSGTTSIRPTTRKHD